MLTLLEALARIAASTATNEGLDAMVELPLEPGFVASVREALTIPRIEQWPTPVRIDRSLRNWQLVDEQGRTVARVHPWDETPNEARMVMDRTPSKESVEAFVARVESLARDAEQLFPEKSPAAHLMALATWARKLVSMPFENAEREVRRLTSG